MKKELGWHLEVRHKLAAHSFPQFCVLPAVEQVPFPLQTSRSAADRDPGYFPTAGLGGRRWGTEVALDLVLAGTWWKYTEGW